MPFGLFGGLGGLNGSMSSRWSLSGDGPNLLESDNITFKHSSTSSYKYSCFGGYSGGFSWGRAAGDLLGAATIFGLALFGRKNNNKHSGEYAQA